MDELKELQKDQEPGSPEQPARRRRRAERYEEQPEPPEVFSGFDNADHSETAREVANRYRQRKIPSVPGDTNRYPAQAQRAAGNAPRERVGYASGHMGGTPAQRARMSEAGRARLAAESRGAEGRGMDGREPAREPQVRNPERNAGTAGRNCSFPTRGAGSKRKTSGVR